MLTADEQAQKNEDSLLFTASEPGPEQSFGIWYTHAGNDSGL